MRHFFVIAFWVWVTSVSAQQATSSFLRFGLHDGRMLAKAYLKPFGEILGTNLNSGWYSSAGIHKLGGFDITVIFVHLINVVSQAQGRYVVISERQHADYATNHRSAQQYPNIDVPNGS